MMSDHLSAPEKSLLLKLARQALEEGVRRGELSRLETGELPETLLRPGAAFVTITHHGELRGCVGTLEARLPLVEDVREHAVAAGLQDYRFPPVTAGEVDQLEIEISVLTQPQGLSYEDPDDLLGKLRPGVDGVILVDGHRRATFLPQVWEKLPHPEQFLDHLCHKMGAQPDLWRRKKLQVSIYQVEEFRENA